MVTLRCNISGRLFSQKVSIDLSHKIINIDKAHKIITLEIILQNIGTTRLLPKLYQIEVNGINIKDGKLFTKTVYNSENLLTSLDNLQYWYIEPGEIDYKSTLFTISEPYQIISVLITAKYNKRFSTYRTFNIAIT